MWCLSEGNPIPEDMNIRWKQVCGNPVYIMDLPQNDWHTQN